MAVQASSSRVHIHWFRRDLRLDDHKALYAAARTGLPILPLFIFDRDILDKLEDRHDRRVHFIYREITRLNSELALSGSALILRQGKPVEVWKDLLNEWSVGSVSVVRDYEPYAQKRDREIYEFLKSRGIPMTGYKDQVIFEKDDILSQKGEPYKVFTPYAKCWRRYLDGDSTRDYPVEQSQFLRMDPVELPPLEQFGFYQTDELHFPSRSVGDEIIKRYDERRDTPAIRGTSRLSVHLRFGTISIRKLVERALVLNEVYLNELIWREFFQMTLYHNPDSPHKAVKPAYDKIQWENNVEHFEAWCRGETGYRLVDAGMRELNRTGYMHNRLRMITANFLTKHLLTDWRWGERYFAKKLLDFDLASNVGGWQWAAGCGRDAAPYFRIFNPERQLEKHDPGLEYIEKFVPEHQTKSYPSPVIEQKRARERALERYRKALSQV